MYEKHFFQLAVDHGKVVKLVRTRPEIAADASCKAPFHQRILIDTYFNSLVLKNQPIFCSIGWTNAW
jgi:hypothetical protein